MARTAAVGAREGAAEALRACAGRLEDEPKMCAFWNCARTIKSDYTYCYTHYEEERRGKLDTCPGCGRGKYATFDLCLDCNSRPPPRKTAMIASPAGRAGSVEQSDAWEKGDAGVEEFFVYLLKLEGSDGARFYAGHTRELRERLSEHRDGNTVSTAGRNPQLVWFEIFPSRKLAAEQEAELKKLIDDNPREIRRRIIKFQDLVDEVEEL